MRMIFGLVLVVGVGLASFAVYMAKDYVGAYQAELARERQLRDQIVPTVDVVVAARQLRYGERITQEDVRLARWPEASLPEGTFVGFESFFPEGETELRAAVRMMEKDEPLMAVKVTEPGEDAGVSSQLTRGMRAFAIKVDVSTGVSGLLRPGDRVDVYWSGWINRSTSGEEEQEVTQLIQRSLRIIAIDQTADTDTVATTIARTVTVEASPVDVASLAQAQNTGRLSLALVGASDETMSEDVVIDQNVLLGVERQELVQIEEDRPCVIRTRRGGEIIETQIPCTN